MNLMSTFFLKKNRLKRVNLMNSILFQNENNKIRRYDIQTPTVKDGESCKNT